MNRSYEIDMCNGPLLGKILRFSIPLMCSGILQLLFNAADIVVIGQFTGSNALAAVGSTSALNNMIINIFIGLSIGSSILVARYYGAQDWENVHDVVHTSVLPVSYTHLFSLCDLTVMETFYLRIFGPLPAYLMTRRLPTLKRYWSIQINAAGSEIFAIRDTTRRQDRLSYS